jgi:hypothetical protein
MKRTILQRTIDGLRARVPVGDGLPISALAAPDRTRFFANYESARARLEGAAALGETRHPIPALLLYREGICSLARAYAVTAGAEATDDDGVVERFTEWVASKHEPSARVLRDDLSFPGGSPDMLNARELALRVAELGAVMPDVLGLMAPRLPEQVTRRRVIRNAVIVVGLLASVSAIVSYVVRPKNIARDKPAIASSIGFDTKPSGAVNGRIYEQFGFHSNAEAAPWLRIDLESAYDITRIRVYGRHDCCFDQSIPMAVELSNDGQNFTGIAERRTPFDQLDPWEIVPVRPIRARYVRVRALNNTVLVLSEVEVYGNAAR